jgi:arylsulfatase A-like enzyme
MWILVFWLAGALLANARPNIIWVEAADLMPRFMNKLGDGFGHTPNLDRLASEGVHFPNAICQGPMCAPSRNGLLANVYSHNLGFYRNGHMKNVAADYPERTERMHKAVKQWMQNTGPAYPPKTY